MKTVTNGHDFIVVGAGTAGCVLAARLSEDADCRVLLLEAGSRQPLDAVSVPRAWPTLTGSAMDWADETVFLEDIGRSVSWPRGRGLGGSSAINAMAFLRGHRASYDAWITAGAAGWGFDDLLPFFQRSEHFEGRDPAVRGSNGPLSPSPAKSPYVLSTVALEAARERGYPIAADVNSGVEEGFGWSDLNIVDGKRQSAADAYLHPALDRANLDLVTDALVHRLTVTGGRCTGVEYRVDGETFLAECGSEVLVAAGAIGSPVVLLASGIGPPAHLREVGIEVVADLPGVGANLHDHPMSGVVYRSARPISLSNGSGAGEVKGMIRSSADAPWPDVQLFLSAVPVIEPVRPGPRPGEGYTIAISFMAPVSRGSVRLANATPGAPPVIDPRYYADSRDMDAAVAGLRAAREFGATKALAPWRGEEIQPGVDIQDDADMRTYVRRSLRSHQHYGGTCRIGNDEGAVVDTALRVRGIDGLRVVDASVMPSPVSANTNATVYAIAERAAELVRS